MFCGFLSDKDGKRKGGESFAAFMEHALNKVNFYIVALTTT